MTWKRGPRRFIRFAAVLVTLWLLFWGNSALAVVLDDENVLDVVLKDGTNVKLFGEALSAGKKSNRYYYLPVNLHLSQRPDKTPEFLFLKFTTEERADQGGVNGALMHFLMEWGLTPAQETELRAKLEKEHGKAELLGAVPMRPQDESGTFRIVSGTLTDEGMTPSLVTSGKAPLIPGGKVAVASRLTAQGAQLLAATFEKNRSITDVSIALDFSYETLAPAAKGRIVFDWSKYESEYDKLEAEYKKWRSGKKTKKFLGVTLWSNPTYSYSYDEMREHYDFLYEKQVVRLEFDELVADERVAKIRDAFFQYFLSTFAVPAEAEGAPPPPSEEEKKQSPNIRYGNNYKFKQTFINRSFKKKTQVFNLNYRMSIRWPHQLVGNLASWYDGVRNNPRCVASVNLNDPFFQHRDIRFILDLDAKEIFDQTINYVTVNVRKKRNSGRNFEDHVTIDANYVKQNGITAAVTYARGEDRNPDVYEYQVQWSLKGGTVFPADPAWQKGNWEGVTLTPPVVPRKIEVEADLDEMHSSDITRTTVQILYKKFGQATEENVHISPAKGEPLVEKVIFMDRDVKGYAYRLIVNHKEEGKLATEWSAQVNDDYIYAVIPENLLQDQGVMAEAKKAAVETVQHVGESVLSRFEELLGGN